jgi:hypothetical protein
VNVDKVTGEVIGLIHDLTLPMERVEWMKQEGNTDAFKQFVAEVAPQMAKAAWIISFVGHRPGTPVVPVAVKFTVHGNTNDEIVDWVQNIVGFIVAASSQFVQARLLTFDGAPHFTRLLRPAYEFYMDLGTVAWHLPLHRQPVWERRMAEMYAGGPELNSDGPHQAKDWRYATCDGDRRIAVWLANDGAPIIITKETLVMCGIPATHIENSRGSKEDDNFPRKLFSIRNAMRMIATGVRQLEDADPGPFHWQGPERRHRDDVVRHYQELIDGDANSDEELHEMRPRVILGLWRFSRPIDRWVQEVEALNSKAREYIPRVLRGHRGLPQGLAAYVATMPWVCLQLLVSGEGICARERAILAGLGFFYVWLYKKCQVTGTALQSKSSKIPRGSSLRKPVHAMHNDAAVKLLVWFAVVSRRGCYVPSPTRSAAISGDILQEHMHGEVRRRCGHDDRSPVVLDALREILMDADVRAKFGTWPGGIAHRASHTGHRTPGPGSASRTRSRRAIRTRRSLPTSFASSSTPCASSTFTCPMMSSWRFAATVCGRTSRSSGCCPI